MGNLSAEEKAKREVQKFDPNYKLHYQYREYHLQAEDLKCRRPEMETKVNLNRILNSHHVVGLVLTFFINAGLSSRLTRNLLWGSLRNKAFPSDGHQLRQCRRDANHTVSRR